MSWGKEAVLGMIKFFGNRSEPTNKSSLTRNAQIVFYGIIPITESRIHIPIITYSFTAQTHTCACGSVSPKYPARTRALMIYNVLMNRMLSYYCQFTMPVSQTAVALTISHRGLVGRSITMPSSAMSAGVIPLIRAACPSVSGRTFASFWRVSARRPLTAS